MNNKKEVIEKMIDSTMGEGIKLLPSSFQVLYLEYEPLLEKISTKEELKEVSKSMLNNLSNGGTKYVYSITYPEKERITVILQNKLNKKITNKALIEPEYLWELYLNIGYKEKKESLGYTQPPELKKIQKEYILQTTKFLISKEHKLTENSLSNDEFNEILITLDYFLDRGKVYNLGNYPQLKEQILNIIGNSSEFKSFVKNHTNEINYFHEHGKFETEQGNEIISKIISNYISQFKDNKIPKNTSITSLLKPMNEFNFNVPDSFIREFNSYNGGIEKHLTKIYGANKSISDLTPENINMMMVFLTNFKETYSMESLMNYGLREIIKLYFYLPSRIVKEDFVSRIDKMEEFLDVYSSNRNGIVRARMMKQRQTDWKRLEIVPYIEGKNNPHNIRLVVTPSDMYLCKYLNKNNSINLQLKLNDETHIKGFQNSFKDIYTNFYISYGNLFESGNLKQQFYQQLEPLFDLRRKIKK